MGKMQIQSENLEIISIKAKKCELVKKYLSKKHMTKKHLRQNVFSDASDLHIEAQNTIIKITRSKKR
jgi:acetylglutamate synthase